MLVYPESQSSLQILGSLGTRFVPLEGDNPRSPSDIGSAVYFVAISFGNEVPAPRAQMQPACPGLSNGQLESWPCPVSPYS